MQAETAVENSGDGNDMVMSFSQTYSQSSTGTSYSIKDLRYVEIEAPDFINENNASTVVPQIHFYNLGNHTNGGTSVASQNFSDSTAAFLNFRHPVRDFSTDPTTSPYLKGKSAIDEHPMLLTNISETSYVSTSGRPLGDKPMNYIPTTHPGFGSGTDAGYYADVHGWMKVYVDEWNSSSTPPGWERKTYYVPLCQFRKAP